MFSSEYYDKIFKNSFLYNTCDDFFCILVF